MRPALTSVGPLLDPISTSYHLSGGAAGLLSTLPLLAFAGVSPFVARIASRCGIERALFGALVLLVGGTLVRALPSVLALFPGTVLLGSGIACMNVLLPTLIRRDFPERVTTMTAVYATTMSLVAAIASGVAVPIFDVTGGSWRTALTCWALLGGLGLAVWSAQLAHTTRPDSRRPGGPIWRSALAWQLTAFMGTQSFGFYVTVTWLPTILQAHGYSSAAAGGLLFIFQMVSILASAMAPLLARRFTDQRLPAAGSAALTAIGFAGLAAGAPGAVVWIVIQGLGSGATLTFALSFFALRAAVPEQVSQIAGMAQTFGYLFAATGPVVFGVLHDATGGWAVPLLLAVIVSTAEALAGLLAGRARTLPLSRDVSLINAEKGGVTP